MSHDVRVHRPGETAVCSQCGATVRDRWVAMPRHGEHAVEIKTWCRGCLLDAIGLDQEAQKCREEDTVSGECTACGGKGMIHLCVIDGSHDGQFCENRPCPHCGGGACATCAGKGAVVSEYSEAEGGETWEDCPDCRKCEVCDGEGKTKDCANCAQPHALVNIGGCNHTCWSCGGTGGR